MAGRAAHLALVLIAGLAGLTGPAHADVLELRDGTRLVGELVGASPQTIQFETEGGVRLVAVEETASLRFGAALPAAPAPAPAAPELAPAAPEAAAQAPAQRPAPAPAARPAPTASPAAPAPPAARRERLPAGTRLRVRIGDSLDPRQVIKGDRFSARLEAPLATGELELAPAHATVYGVVSAVSSSGPPAARLQLELTGLQVAGRTLKIVTGTQQRLVESAGAAPVPAAAGQARIPSGELLEFRLLQPLEVEWRER